MSGDAVSSVEIDWKNINTLHDRPDIRIANAAIGYVRAFTDCWAFLVNESLPTSYHVNLSVSKAYARWKNAVEIGNPLLTMGDDYNMNKDGGTVEFDIKVNDTNGEHHAAIVLLALDSFMSLLSASDAVQTRSVTSSKTSKDDKGHFSLYVPASVPMETLLSCMVGKRGFPAGDTGPFRKWNTVNAVKLSADEQIGDVMERLATVDGDTTAAAIIATKNVNRYLDDSEMERCITLNNKNRRGDMFTVTSDRKANNNSNMEKGGIIAEAAKVQKKKSRRKRDIYANPAVLVDKFTATLVEKPSKKRKAPEVSSLSSNLPCNLESSRYKFTSLTMSAKDFLIAFDSSSSLRGSQRSKSLVGKFVSLSKTVFVKNKNNKNDKLLSEWISPEDRKLVIVCGASEGKGSAFKVFEIRFKVRCSKSSFFDPVSGTSSTLKHLMKLTGVLITYLKLFGKEIPKFEPITKSISLNLTKMALSLVKGVRPIIGFKVPNCIKFENMSIENKWNSQTFFMGMTAERYNRIIEVFDFMLSRGAFVSAALNSSFFLDAGVRYRHGNRSAAWVNIDLIKVAAECMCHVTDVSRYQERGYPDDHPITKTNETTRQYTERKMTQPVELFINTSYCYRHKNKIQMNITETGRKALDKLLDTRGAISAFMEGTISVDTRSALAESKKNKTYWNQWKLEELDTLYGMSDAYKTGQMCSPDSNGSCSQDECGDISRPPPKRWNQELSASLPQTSVQVAANTIVVASVLTYPALAKATSSKHFP